MDYSLLLSTAALTVAVYAFVRTIRRPKPIDVRLKVGCGVLWRLKLCEVTAVPTPASPWVTVKHPHGDIHNVAASEVTYVAGRMDNAQLQLRIKAWRDGAHDPELDAKLGSKSVTTP